MQVLILTVIWPLVSEPSLAAHLCLQTDLAVPEYKRAVELQPGYVTAWNNLGDAYEKSKQWRWVVGSKLKLACLKPVAMERVAGTMVQGQQWLQHHESLYNSITAPLANDCALQGGPGCLLRGTHVCAQQHSCTAACRLLQGQD